MKKNRSYRLVSILLVMPLWLVSNASRASHSGSMGLPSVPREQFTPEQEANALFNDGLAYQHKAAKFEKEAESETDAKKKAKWEAKARDKHEDSIKKFTEATKKNPQHYPAWGNLGYAYRKIGNYPASLEAYGKALEIRPDYTPAIEYRAEAYLGQNKLDEVKSAYMSLFSTDRPRADELVAAVEKWLEKKKADPSGVDPAKLEEFSKWADERKQLASQVSSVMNPKTQPW